MATIKERIDGVTENVTDGKTVIASAITEKGVDTNSSATFSVMADNIRAIETPPRDRIVNSANTIYVIAGESGVTIGNSGNTASGRYSTAEGDNTEASDDACHAEGYQTKATGMYSHSEGYQSKAIGNYSHAEGGYQTIASGMCSHVEGYGAEANGEASHAEGYLTKATGDYSHSEGQSTVASDVCAHAEGYSTEASGENSHAEGSQTKALGWQSHAEGFMTEAYGEASHAEGQYTYANGDMSHATGTHTQAVGSFSYAGGDGSVASGTTSFTHGIGTKSYNNCEFSCGRYNASHVGTTGSTTASLFTIGYGSKDTDQKNTIEITQTGVLKANQAWTTGSDRKLKDNITPLENNTLEKVLQLNPVRFTLKSDIDKKERIGFIAQEVEELFPQYVTVSIGDDNEETRYLDYSQMVSVLCKAIQEQQKKIEALEAKIN